MRALIRRLPVALACALAAPSIAVAQTSAAASNQTLTEAACTSIKTEFSALQDQLPVDVDYMTKLIGVSAMMGSRECMVSYVYVYEEDALIDEVVKSAAQEGNALSREAVLEFFTSENGAAILKQLFREQAQQVVNGIEVNGANLGFQVLYKSDDVNLDAVTVRF
ncbi:MAG: hypothetical protein AWU57_579 [Marinobacter sp. T13-3]|nr:MAG: hypothetical protein AWU57_579 [Marinobacter sp. T13-3]